MSLLRWLPVALLCLPIGTARSAEAVSASAFFGSWQATAQHPSGASIAAMVEFKPNMQFTASATLNNAPLMQAAGTWKVTGRTLEWRYLESSTASIPKGLIDVDDVEGAGPNEIRLKSRLTGRLTVYRRVR